MLIRGPIGLDKVLAAIAHARKNPSTVPIVVGRNCDRPIQRRQKAIRATRIDASTPPRIPQTQRPALPNE
ncbi:MAG: hypothetical protein LC674_04900 [Actinobacteria bacterium]|nr:hypothetical protein [Actinomycetota bacterium]